MSFTLLKLMNDSSKFNTLETDTTILIEGQVHIILRKLKRKCLFSDKIYDNIYPKGS